MCEFPPQIQVRIDRGMGCGSGIGPGWMAALIELDAQIAAICPDYNIDQIKEKFGEFRFYYSNVSEDKYEAVSDLVHSAESRIDHMCEECGAPGMIRGKRWLKTLCEKHGNEHETAL